ncbi:MAG: hypothetical protein AB7I79_20505 [Rhizobiaceae bacterium]
MFLVRLVKRLVKAVLWLIAIVIAIPIAGLAYGFLTTPSFVGASPSVPHTDAPPPELAEQVRAEIPGYKRPEESTYLTYPEWAIVYAAREYAEYLETGRESGFPYWPYVGRFWQDYAMVIRASWEYPFNFANHQMLAVIGTSHTIEHVAQWAYENTVGRITEWTSGRPTAVDHYLAGVAAEYAAFLDQVPWYQFPYAEKRAGLMAVQPATDDDGMRTAERRWAFGAAYWIKQGYADLIRAGLSATADPALLDIHVWARGPVAEAIAGEPDTTLEKDFGEAGAVFVTKRYQVFTEMIPRLIGKGVSFVEIGGNDDILITVLSQGPAPVPEGAKALFAYPLPAEPATERTGLVVSVRRLHTVLPALSAGNIRLEHVYDY